MPVFPDALVKLLCEEIAFNGGEVQLPHVWVIATNFVELTDEKIKEYVFLCLLADPDVMLIEDGNEVHKNYTDVVAKEDQYCITIKEDRLWTILTGYKKKESNLGGSAFELLLEIAKSKDRGINTKDLAIATNQDPRSITGRIKKLEGLICSVQMIYKGHVVKLLKLQKFSTSDSVVKPYVNIREYLPKIVEIVKKSKNGVRQIIDLRRELKLDLDKRLSKSFIAAINWLSEKGHLKKVLVVSPTNTSVKIRCVKYLRDYFAEGKAMDFEYESDSGDDDNIDYDKAAAADEDAFEGLDSFNATSLLQDDGLVVDEKNDFEKATFLLNRFFPIQNQTYDFADESGIHGVSTMQVINKLTGADYRRAFTKSSELYVKNVGKQNRSSNGYDIVRVYDFEGKKKFYRFFTAANFDKLTGEAPLSAETSFAPISNQAENLASLSEASFASLSSTLRFINRAGEDRFFWNGELKVPPSINAPSRGRKRKHEEDLMNHEKRKFDTGNRKESKLASRSPPDVRSQTGVLDSEASKRTSLVDSEAINVGGFSANSLRSLWRQRAILEVVKRAGGVTYLREQFFESVSRFMGSSTILDKKTVRGDVTLLIKANKLRDRVEPKTGRRIVYLIDVDGNTVDDYVVKQKDNKKAHFNDIIHNTDIYFFDQTEKNKFHRGVKSAERVRQFQRRSKKKLVAAEVANRNVHENSENLLKIGSENNSQKLYKRREKGQVTARLEGSRGVRPRITFHMGSKDGPRALLMAVVISKSIKNEISWDKITRLFPSNSLENLKKQWTILRVKMGHNGWRAHVDKWRKILVSAIKDETMTLEEAENLDLLKLITLWMAFDETSNQPSVRLYRSYAENKKHYTFVSDSRSAMAKVGLAMSSMVQRETSLLKKVYLYSTANVEESQELKLEDKVKMIIRSLLFGDSSIAKDDIESLKELPREMVDKVIMDMAKAKQISLSGSKLEATNVIPEILESKGNYDDFEKSRIYIRKLKEMFEARNGIVISEEISDVVSWTLIDLMCRRSIRLYSLSATRSSQPLSYTTKRLGISALTPSLVVTLRGQKIFDKPKHVAIPTKEANVRLWIDSSGAVRERVWKCLIAMVIREVLFNPGIQVQGMLENCGKILSTEEMKEICNWLLSKGHLLQTPFKGFRVTDQWYRLME